MPEPSASFAERSPACELNEALTAHHALQAGIRPKPAAGRTPKVNSERPKGSEVRGCLIHSEQAKFLGAQEGGHDLAQAIDGILLATCSRASRLRRAAPSRSVIHRSRLRSASHRIVLFSIHESLVL
jgi:hypothetical protein